MPETETWIEYKRLVITKLEELTSGHDSFMEKLNNIDKRLTVVETKAAMLGGIAGFVAYLLPKLIEKFL